MQYKIVTIPYSATRDCLGCPSMPPQIDPENVQNVCNYQAAQGWVLIHTFTEDTNYKSCSCCSPTSLRTVFLIFARQV